MKYPAIYIRNKEDDIITDGQGNEIATVLDYWKWAHSCLMDNAERGAFAEYLVASAVGGKGEGRINWEKYDVISEEGITIEVKHLLIFRYGDRRSYLTSALEYRKHVL